MFCFLLLPNKTVHMTTNLLWTPIVMVDPQLPLTSGQDLWPLPEKSCQASLASCIGQNNKTILWCDDVLSSCDHTHSPSVVPVRSNKHCESPLFLLTAISYGASRLISSALTPHNSTLLTSNSSDQADHACLCHSQRLDAHQRWTCQWTEQLI